MVACRKGESGPRRRAREQGAVQHAERPSPARRGLFASTTRRDEEKIEHNRGDEELDGNTSVGHGLYGRI